MLKLWPIRDEIELESVNRPRQRDPANQQDKHQEIRARCSKIHHLKNGMGLAREITCNGGQELWHHQWCHKGTIYDVIKKLKEVAYFTNYSVQPPGVLSNEWNKILRAQWIVNSPTSVKLIEVSDMWHALNSNLEEGTKFNFGFMWWILQWCHRESTNETFRINNVLHASQLRLVKYFSC